MKRNAGPHTDLRAAAKAGEDVVRLTSIQESHIKTIERLQAYKKPCLIKVAMWICKQFMAIARDSVWVNDCIHAEFKRDQNSFLEQTLVAMERLEKDIVRAALLACHFLSHLLMDGGKKAKAEGATKFSQAHCAMISQPEKIKKEYFRSTGEEAKYGVQTRWGSGAKQQS